MSKIERNVVYGMYSGLALLADVHQPEQPNGHGVVYINGSGWHAPLAFNATPLNRVPLGLPYIEALQQAGDIVFAINHRAAPRFKYPAAVEDAQRAVRYVRHHAAAYGIDPNRIGAAGGSSGGHLVSLLGTLKGNGDSESGDAVDRESARVQCVVARAAPVDLARFVRPGARGVGTAVADFMSMLPRTETEGDWSVESRTYAEASPLTHVAADTAPFLLIHGDNDETVPFEQSELMRDALQKQGVPVELICIPGAGHGPNFPGAINPPDYLGAMVRWFDRHLRGA